MLTAAQCRIEAYHTADGDFFCPACAAEEFGGFKVALADEGMSNTPLTAVIQYTLGEYQTAEAENYIEYLAQERGPASWTPDGYRFEDGTLVAEEDIEDSIYCASCNGDLTS